MKNDNHFDLAFVCDATGSMGGFMSAAKREMIALIKEFAKRSDVDVRFGLVWFRDHCDPVVTEVFDFTGNFKVAEKYVKQLTPTGGGDHPEAVFDGIHDAVNNLKWRIYSRRIIILVGDAPPHGTKGSSSYPDKCKCGKTLAETTALVEEYCITLHGICLTSETHFDEIAHLTGGMTFDANRHGDAMKEIKRLLDDEFGNIKFDRKVLELFRKDKDQNQIAEELEATPWQVGSALGRLGNRNLLGEGEPILESAEV